MAEAFLKKHDPAFEVFSAGPEPARVVHPFTVQAMKEIGYDISGAKTKDVTGFINENWDYVITVCDIARAACPVFSGNVKTSLYLKFDDPLSYEGDNEFLLKLVRTTRDNIKMEFEDFYHDFLKQNKQK